MVSVFLGAGFSLLGGVPLASQLFYEQPLVDVISRQRLIECVLDGWENWHSRMGGTPEQYLAYLKENSYKQWDDAIWYVALVITLSMPNVGVVGIGYRQNPTITRHTLNRTPGIKEHEDFWTAIFRRTTDICVLTTNYDILAEQGLRMEPRPRLPRPGFHYGDGSEQLEGRGYPGVFASKPPNTKGKVPLLKLHGSVSWSLSGNRINRYHDCRPAIRGDAAIIAPVTEKSVPSMFQPIWNHAASALNKSNTLIIVGYSFPEYDVAISKLFQSTVNRGTRVHIMNPDPKVFRKVQSLLPDTDVFSHSGIPDALDDLPDILEN